MNRLTVVFALCAAFTLCTAQEFIPDSVEGIVPEMELFTPPPGFEAVAQLLAEDGDDPAPAAPAAGSGTPAAKPAAAPATPAAKPAPTAAAESPPPADMRADTAPADAAPAAPAPDAAPATKPAAVPQVAPVGEVPQDVVPLAAGSAAAPPPQEDEDKVPKAFSLPHIHVPDAQETKEAIAASLPPAIHKDPLYWKLKKLKQDYQFKKGYQEMRRELLKKYLKTHYASQLVRDHMRRRVDTLRRQSALKRFGLGAHYKPFTWGEYDEPGKSEEPAPEAASPPPAPAPAPKAPANVDPDGVDPVGATGGVTGDGDGGDGDGDSEEAFIEMAYLDGWNA